MPEIFPLLVLAAVLLIIGFGIVAIARAFVARIVVQEYERAVLFRNGRLVGALEPGAYWLRTLFPAHTWRIVDLRERVQVVAGQEIPTADAVSVKISLAVVFSVVDPVKAVLQAEDFQQVLYNALQIVLRDSVAALEVDALLEKRAELGARLQEQTVAQVERYGIALHSAQVRDIMFPGALKQTMAQVVAARKEGLATLERARGETAALRHLANAASLFEKNPALMTLRAIQALHATSGNTVVLNLGPEKPPVL